MVVDEDEDWVLSEPPVKPMSQVAQNESQNAAASDEKSSSKQEEIVKAT